MICFIFQDTKTQGTLNWRIASEVRRKQVEYVVLEAGQLFNAAWYVK